MFPTDGDEGWEEIGIELDPVPTPHVWALPKVERGFYYDPRRINRIGTAIPFVARLYGGGGCAVRYRLRSVEAELSHSRVFGVTLLDSMIVPDVGAPCTVLLEVYDDDRTTVLWAVSTDPEHPFPFLIEPDHYAEQEIDVATGSAMIGTVSVTVIDKARIAGDQDSGFLTNLLSSAGFGAIKGRRCRLRRFISVELGYQVLADGPASEPRMDPSYAAFGFEIRDTRESERKIVAFDKVPNQGILPEGPIDGFATLLAALTPMVGRFVAHIGGFGPSAIEIEPYNVVQLRSASQGAWDVVGDITIPFPNDPLDSNDVTLMWRLQSSGDPWTVLRRPEAYIRLVGDLATTTAPPAVFSIIVHMPPYRPNGAIHPDLPANHDMIEFMLTGSMSPSTGHPIHIEHLTAGELTKNVYDGIYSARDENGDPVPTGVRYDEAAVLAMTTPVQLRLTERVEDARDWLEKRIYAPLGMVPALDSLGLISPVSQVPPEDITALPVFNNDITEPSSNWSAGERIYNVIRFLAERHYKPTDPADADGDTLKAKSILIEYRDPVSVLRNGENILELDGTAFASSGDPDGTTSFDIETQELAYQLAALRNTYLMNRYSLGAPAMRLTVRRSVTATRRVGDWVILDLTWMPDYFTGKRGLLTLGQIVGLGDLDCAWRAALIEVVVPLLVGS